MSWEFWRYENLFFNFFLKSEKNNCHEDTANKPEVWIVVENIWAELTVLAESQKLIVAVCPLWDNFNLKVNAVDHNINYIINLIYAVNVSMFFYMCLLLFVYILPELKVCTTLTKHIRNCSWLQVLMVKQLL